MERIEPHISWQIEEYAHRDKGADCYWALGIVAVLGAAVAVFTHNILFAVVILLGGGMLGFYAARKPEVIGIAIYKDGVLAREIFYPFSEIKGFSIDPHARGSYLLIETSRVILPVISLPLPDEGLDFAALADYLRAKVSEKRLTEPPAHRLMEHLGF